MFSVWLLLVFTGILLISPYSKSQSPFSPIRTYLYGWLLVLGSMASGMIHFNRTLSLATFLLVVGSHTFFFVGSYLAELNFNRPTGDPQRYRSRHIRDDFDRLIIGSLCILAIIGAVIAFQELFFGRGQLLLNNFSSELGKTRNSRWELFFSGNSDVSPFRSLTVAACLAISTLLALARRGNHRVLLFVSVVSVVVVIVQSFLGAGRFLFGVLILCLLVSNALVYGGTSMRRLFTWPRLFVGGAIAFYFLIVFPTQRNPVLASIVERSIQWSSDAELAGWVKQIGDIEGMAWIKILAYSLRYFSGSLDKLNFFVTETDALSWYKLGLYNLTQVSQLLGAFFDGVTPWHQVRLDIANLMHHEGWGLNPWATGIRDLGIDFGHYGAIVVIGILGFVGQRIFVLSQTNGSYVSLIAATYVSVACFIFAFVSPFQIRALGNSFWLLGFIALLRYVVAKAAAGHKRASIVATEG